MALARFRADSPELFAATASAAVCVLRSLITLERHLADLRRWMARLDAAYGVGRPTLALEAVLGVHRVFEAVAKRYVRIRRHVIAFDGATLGDAVGSLGELSLRAQMLVIVVQLSRLRQVMLGDVRADNADPPAGATDRASTPAESGALLRVGAVVHQAFDRLTAAWLPHRPSVGDGSSDGPLPDELQAKRYREAIHQAQREMAALAEVPSVAAFLAYGTTSRDRPSVQLPCTLISAALGCRLTTELDRSLWRPPTIATATARACAAGGTQ